MKKRLDGRYAKQVVIGHREDGSKIVKTVYGTTKKEAEAKATAIKADLGKGIDVQGSCNTYKQWAEIFLASEEIRQSPHLYASKKNMVEFFYDYIGNVKISEVLPIQLEKALEDLSRCNVKTGKPASRKTVLEYKNACGQVFKTAIRNRACSFNPAEYAQMPTVTMPKKERRALSREERTWIEECTCYARLPAMIAMYAGLRRGEIGALTWNDIDLKKGIITVSKSYDYNNHISKEPKTASGIRTVPIPQVLADALRKAPKRSIFVVSANGKQTTSAGWEKLLRDLLQEIESNHGTAKGAKVKCGGKYTTLISFEPFGWHDLRHTYATILYEAGADPESAKELLGHKDYSTTINVYTHLSEEQKSRSIQKLSEYLDSQRTVS